jgi:hypothetical protein
MKQDRFSAGNAAIEPNTSAEGPQPENFLEQATP